MERANVIITNNKKEALDIILYHITELLKIKKEIVLGLPGGRSIQSFFHMMVDEEKIPWAKIHIFMVDERLVSLNHEHSNYKMVRENFLDNLIAKKKISEKNIHPFVFEKFTILEYENELKKYGGKFDIVILGVGEDGHVAALYPNASIKKEAEYFFELHDSPKPPKDRMTASRKLILKSSLGLFLFLGESKRAAYEKFKDKTISVEDCPAKLAYKLKESIVLTDLE